MPTIGLHFNIFIVNHNFVGEPNAVNPTGISQCMLALYHMSNASLAPAHGKDFHRR